MDLSLARVGQFLLFAGLAVAAASLVVFSICWFAMPAALTPIAFTMDGAMLVAFIGVLLYGKATQE